MGTEIHHFTQVDQWKQIVESQKLLLEGSDFLENEGKYAARSLEWARLLKKQYEVIGRYVWFTQSSIYKANGDISSHRFGVTVYAEDVGAKRWHYLKRENQNNPEFTAEAKLMDKQAKARGDNPYDWWVVDHEIDLSKLDEGRLMYLTPDGFGDMMDARIND